MSTNLENHPNQKEKAIEGQNPLISVIIPVYNSEKTLGECLQAIKDQTYRPIEIIVVDSHSKDNTAAIAEQHGARVFQLDGVPNKKRQYGVTQAQGKFIFHLDSDMVASPTVTQQLYDRFQKGDVDALDFTQESIARNFWAECLARNRGAFVESGIYLTSFFLKEHLEKIPMDDEILFGDDYALYLEFKKAGMRMATVPAVVKHYEPVSLKRMMRRNFEAYKNFPNFVKKYGVANSSTRFTSFTRSTTRKWILNGQFVKDPIHFLGLIFMKALVVVSASAGMVAGLLGSHTRSH